jgi:hypothetical protein
VLKNRAALLTVSLGIFAITLDGAPDILEHHSPRAVAQTEMMAT